MRRVIVLSCGSSAHSIDQFDVINPFISDVARPVDHPDQDLILIQSNLRVNPTEYQNGTPIGTFLHTQQFDVISVCEDHEAHISDAEFAIEIKPLTETC